MNSSVLRQSLRGPALLVIGILLGWVGLFAACSDNQIDSLEEVRELQAKGRFPATIEPLRALLDENPNQPEASYLLGKALVRTGDQSLAIWPLRKAIESPDYEVEAGILLARALFVGRTADDSIEVASRILEIEPDNVDALAIRAQSYVQVSRLKEGLVDIERVAELDPGNLPILVPRIMALLRLERLDAVAEAMELAKQVVAESDEEVSRNLRGRLCVVAALFAFERGDPESAEQQYADCLEAYPANSLVIQNVVEYHDRLGNTDRADEILEHAFDESRDPAFRRAMAVRAGQRGDLERQEALMREQAEEQDSAASWFTLGNYYAERERYDEACDSFEQAVSIAPEPLMLFAYADTLILADRLDEAESVSERIGQQELRDLLSGRILLERGDAAGALRSFEAGIRLWPNNAGARFLAGQAAERLGDFDRAISEYREAERVNPRQTEAGFYLAGLLADMGSIRAALTSVQRYVKTHPSDPEGLLLAIDIAHRAGRKKVAGEALVRFARLPGKAALGIAEQARLVAEMKGSEEGVKAIESSLLDFSDPSNEPVLRELVIQLGKLGRHDSARGRVTVALETHPEEADFHEIAARVELASGGSTEAALAAFQRAAELDPNHVGALMGLADLSVAEGDVPGAIAYYDRVIEADEDDAQAGNAAAALVLESGNAEDAERRLLAVLKRHPRDVPAALSLARLLANRGEDLERALHYARRADYFRSMPEAAEVLGWVLVLRGQPSDAVEPLRRSIQQRPQSTAAHLYLGQALASTGDREGAREAFEMVIEAAGPEAPQARSALEGLEEAG